MPNRKIQRYSSFRKNADGTRSIQADEFDAFRDRYWRIRADDF
jgi:hypothetical protein